MSGIETSVQSGNQVDMERMSGKDFVELALKVLGNRTVYEDWLVKIERTSGEVHITRKAQPNWNEPHLKEENPVTYATVIDGNVIEVYRHHGEHCYVVPHLKTLGEWAETLHRLQADSNWDIDTLRSALRTARQRESGDTWIWAGDGNDRLESMSSGMTVVISAGAIRGLIDDAVSARGGLVRDENGFGDHPAFRWDEIPEEQSFRPYIKRWGFECQFVSMDGDAPEKLTDRYFEEGLSSCKFWSPSRPDGEGWFLGSIYDNEEGPQAVWMRPLKVAASCAGELNEIADGAWGDGPAVRGADGIKMQEDLDAAHAKIDALMLEHCSDEMTPEQKARWAANQAAAMERQS